MLLHTNSEKTNKVHSKNSEYNNDIQNVQAQEFETEKEMLKIPGEHTLSDGDLIEYMYQHVQFDEKPFEDDPLYDHRQIYSHDMSHIEYGFYEDIEATAEFYVHMQKDNENTSIEDENTAYIYNLGQPVSEGHNTSVQATQSEIYNDEQNEILEMNAENTRRTQEAKRKADENIMNIHRSANDAGLYTHH